MWGLSSNMYVIGYSPWQQFLLEVAVLKMVVCFVDLQSRLALDVSLHCNLDTSYAIGDGIGVEIAMKNC